MLTRSYLCILGCGLLLACHSGYNATPEDEDLTDLYSDDAVAEADDAVAEAVVAFTDEPAYDAANTDEVMFKVEASNESAASFVYGFMHGSNLDCKNASWQRGNFNTTTTITDSHDYGDRLICVRGVDAEGRMSAVIVPFRFKKQEPQAASSSVAVQVTIDTNHMMTVEKVANSAATNFKWCVAAESAGCPIPDDDGAYDSTNACTLKEEPNLGKTDISAAVSSTGDGDLIACVIGSDGTNQKLSKSGAFKKGEAPAPIQPPDTGQTSTFPPNNGKLVALLAGRIFYHVIGKQKCHAGTFKNTGTDTITVKFNYDNDSDTNRTRRLAMFSDIVYQVYPVANHNAVRGALYSSYCLNGQLGAGKALNNGDTFDLPAGHQVVTVFKAKDPTSTKHDAKYFNQHSYACVQMTLRDLNNNKEISKYRCLRRAELSVYSMYRDEGKEALLAELQRDANGEYVIELSLSKSRHKKFTIVNAVIADAIAARSTDAGKDYVKNSYPLDLEWSIVGDPDEGVPSWLYQIGENFTKKDDDGQRIPITVDDQFQVGIRQSKIDAGDVELPKVGDSYRFLLLSNSLSDRTCQTTPLTYTTERVSGTGENRRSSTKKLDFCPREDVLHIKIVP